MASRGALRTVTPLVPAGPEMADALEFYREHLGFTVLWHDDGMAGVGRDGIEFNLVRSSDRAWAENASFSIGVEALDALYEEYRGIPAQVGALETKPWGRREFHMILPSRVCLQFYEVAP